MFVDTAMLRMGADFADSAGEIARRGASQFSATTLTAGIFGDFEQAEEFHKAVSQAHNHHANNMQGHHATLGALAENATAAATIFTKQDEASASTLDAAGCTFDV